jgi:hypothetical protein
MHARSNPSFHCLTPFTDLMLFRDKWGRICLGLMILGISVLYVIILINPEHAVTIPQYALLPAVLMGMLLALLATYRVKNEIQHQYMWVIIYAMEASLLTAHQMAWRSSFSTEITQSLLPHADNDPTALFYLVETGWWVDLCSSDVCCCY